MVEAVDSAVLFSAVNLGSRVDVDSYLVIGIVEVLAVSVIVLEVILNADEVVAAVGSFVFVVGSVELINSILGVIIAVGTVVYVL